MWRSQGAVAGVIGGYLMLTKLMQAALACAIAVTLTACTTDDQGNFRMFGMTQAEAVQSANDVQEITPVPIPFFSWLDEAALGLWGLAGGLYGVRKKREAGEYANTAEVIGDGFRELVMAIEEFKRDSPQGWDALRDLLGGDDGLNESTTKLVANVKRGAPPA